MIQGITTSIRLPIKLREKLDKVSHALHRGKNWIITKALEEYLSKLNQSNLVEEARRQSILASRKDKKKDHSWENNADTSGWV